MGNDLVYDDVEAIAQVPYLNANDPTRSKNWTGIDIAARGTWKMYMALLPLNEDAKDKIAQVDGSTFEGGSIGAIGQSTHISIIFKSQGSGYAKLGSAVIHYESSADED